MPPKKYIVWYCLKDKTATWIFSLVVIPLFKKVSTLYESVGSNLGIFKIYMCVSLD